MRMRARGGRSEQRWQRSLATAVALAVLLAALSGCATYRRWQKHSRETSPPYKIVLPQVAYEIIRDNSGILILDLRTPEEFMGATGHLPHAVNIQLANLPYRLVEIASYRSETLLVYCNTTACAEAGMAVLLSSGFGDGILIDGGIDAWIRAGFRTFLPATEVGKVRPARVPELATSAPKELPVLPRVGPPLPTGPPQKPPAPPQTPPPPPATPPPAG